MDTRMAPNYAIIIMYYLENNFLDTILTKPKLQIRPTGGIFAIWPYG